jgi:hypothetical protein
VTLKVASVTLQVLDPDPAVLQNGAVAINFKSGWEVIWESLLLGYIKDSFVRTTDPDVQQVKGIDWLVVAVLAITQASNDAIEFAFFNYTLVSDHMASLFQSELGFKQS